MKTYTICNRVDGFGAQYLAIMSCFAFCYNNENATYIHTPFKKLCHGQSVEKLNEFIGLPVHNTIPKNIDKKKNIFQQFTGLQILIFIIQKKLERF